MIVYKLLLQQNGNEFEYEEKFISNPPAFVVWRASNAINRIAEKTNYNLNGLLQSFINGVDVTNTPKR